MPSPKANQVTSDTNAHGIDKAHTNIPGKNGKKRVVDGAVFEEVGGPASTKHTKGKKKSHKEGVAKVAAMTTKGMKKDKMGKAEMSEGQIGANTQSDHDFDD